MIEVYLQFEHAVFELKVLFPFPLVTATCIGDYFINKQYAQNFGASIYSRVINITYLFCPQIKSRCDHPCANGDADRVHSAN